jgi:hypothetical protein
MSRISPKKFHLKNRKSVGNTRDKSIQSALYEIAPNEYLFVPSDDMWLVHELNKPAVVLERAGLRPRFWERLKGRFESNPVLFDWVYGHLRKLPEDATPRCDVLEKLLAFRAAASVKVVATKAIRNPERLATRKRESSHVTEQTIYHWLRVYQEHPWFERWLLRGQDQVERVTIVTADEVRRGRKAMDWRRICRAAGLNPTSSYSRWLHTGKIPDQRFRQWLYGGPAPNGVFIVGEELQRLHDEMSETGVCKKAGITVDCACYWIKHPRLKLILEEAIRVAGNVQSEQRFLSQPEPEGRKRGRPGVLNRILAYAKAKLPSACCERAGVDYRHYHEELSQAKRLGAKDELLRYLRSEGCYSGWSQPRYGLFAQNFFIPSDGIFKFREEAKRVAVDQRSAELWRIPGFDKWFEDWTNPYSDSDEHNGQPSTGDGQSFNGEQIETLIAAMPPIENLTIASANHVILEKVNSAILPPANPTRAQRGKQAVAGLERGTPGRPSTNDEVVNYFLDQKRRDRSLRIKQILKQFKQEHPEHPIFSNQNPEGALRNALYERRKASSPKNEPN